MAANGGLGFGATWLGGGGGGGGGGGLRILSTYAHAHAHASVVPHQSRLFEVN